MKAPPGGGWCKPACKQAEPPMSWGTRLLLRKNPQLLASTPPTRFQVPPVGSKLCKISGLPAPPCLGMPSGALQAYWSGVETLVSGRQIGRESRGPKAGVEAGPRAHTEGRVEALSKHSAWDRSMWGGRLPAPTLTQPSQDSSAVCR